MTVLRNKRKERQRQLKKEVHWLKSKWHRTTNREEKQRWVGGGHADEKERHTCLSVPSLWYDKFMHSSCVCQSRPGVFVGLFNREEGVKKREERKGGKKQEREKEGRELRNCAVTAGNGLILIGVDCVPCVDSMSPQSLGLGEEPGN